ncbi:MAG: response regulator, partial [Pseudobdellovibrio sp.]
LFINCLNVNTSSKNLLDEEFFMSLPKGSYYISFVRPWTYDVDGMINLILNYHSVSYLARSIEAWIEADQIIDEVLKVENQIHTAILLTPKNQPLQQQQEFLQTISNLNVRVTVLADRFTFSLGEASRWVEDTLFLALLCVILLVESTGLFFTFRFSQTLLRSLQELNSTAKKIGTGDLSPRAPVHSRDELGQLAASLNQMSSDLQALSGEKHVAEEANQIKSLFLANMSHEIRTPLGAILGFVDLLKEKDLSEEKRSQYLNIISRTGDTLVTIINDILDLSKVEAGKLEMNKEVCSLKQLMADLQLLLKLRSDDKGILFSIQPQADAPEFIYTDPLRLRQILINIIGNSIKFTQVGGVVVRYKAERDQLVFEVQDTGPGLSEAEIAKLFKPFSQTDLSIRKNHGGTGLGLVLSRRLAQLLGGTVVLKESIVGRGSLFSITIDYRVPEHLQTKKLPIVENQDVHGPESLAGRRILLVEDTVENQILISHILEKFAAEVSVVGNGQEALKVIRSQSFDIILMDMQMPVLDGYETTERLRNEGFAKPIIGLTAHAMQEDLKKCIDVGCDEVLTKPVHQSVLIQTIKRFCT